MTRHFKKTCSPFLTLLCFLVLSVTLTGCNVTAMSEDGVEDMTSAQAAKKTQSADASDKFLKIKPALPASESADIQKYIRPIPTISSLPPYRLQVGDVLQVKFLLNSEFNEEVVIRPDGMISTLIAQDIQAYGLTAIELQDSLVDLYEEELSDPRLAVIVKSFSPMRVSILGEVARPGEMIAVDPNLSLLQAIARAGGILPSSNPKRVIILRRGAGGEGYVFEANYKHAVNGVDPMQNMRLTSHDVVIVPRSDVANVYHYYRQFIQQFLPSSLGLGYDLN